MDQINVNVAFVSGMLVHSSRSQETRAEAELDAGRKTSIFTAISLTIFRRLSSLATFLRKSRAISS